MQLAMKKMIIVGGSIKTEGSCNVATCPALNSISATAPQIKSKVAKTIL